VKRLAKPGGWLYRRWRQGKVLEVTGNDEKRGGRRHWNKLKERRINKQKVRTEMKWRRKRRKADAGKSEEGCPTQGVEGRGCKLIQYRGSEFLGI
jgi:hypothetical protein